MRKLISIILIVVCVCCLASCKNNKKLPDDPVTTTPPASQQGGEVTDGTSDNNQGVENNFPVDPNNSGDPGIDLEEDILDTEDDPTATEGIITPTAAPNQTNTPTTNQGTENTVAPTATAAPTLTAAPNQPTASQAPAKPTATSSTITLPMDKF